MWSVGGVVAETWGGADGEVGDEPEQHFCRLVLDAIVKHLKKCVTFISLWKMSLNVS